MLTTSDVTLSQEIITLAAGPDSVAWTYNACNVNGFHFRVKGMDDHRVTQNSGVALKAETLSYASRRDNNPRVGVVYYYGQLTDIIKVRYSNSMPYVMFKCNWIDNNHGKKEDGLKFTLVNFNHLLYRDNRVIDEPFIFASQAEQVWYASDALAPQWHVVVKMSQRGLFDMNSAVPQADPYISQQLEANVVVIDDADANWVRGGTEGETAADVNT